ncbi:MAG: helix-turn-helix transcriptional regulator [Bacteroidota bacterium]
MRHLEYDKKLARTIKVLRELKRIKQFVISNALDMTQATYCKIEKGEIAITPGQLKIISEELGTSNFQILAIVEADNIINIKHTTLSEILLKFVQMVEGVNENSKLTSEELEFLIQKIRHRHQKLTS